jgi:prolipoprotein diacylglyceryltransferase
VPKKSGDIFVIYILTYSLGRLWIEALRIDDANLIFGVRLNIWVSLIAIITAYMYLARSKAGKNEAKKIVSS